MGQRRRKTPGCFRCHGTLVNTKTQQLLPGTMGGGGCWSCHGVASDSTTEIGAVDPLKTQTCSYCHHTVEEQAVGIAATTAEPTLPWAYRTITGGSTGASTQPPPDNHR
jgi:hypothetical protein